MVRPRENGHAAGTGPLRVTHVIAALEAGGAENMLYKLVSATRADARHSVVTLLRGGHYAPRLVAEGVPVRSLDMRRGAPNPLAIVRLARHFRRERPDVIHGWMYHSNLLAGLASAAAHHIPVVWGIHHTSTLEGSTKPTTRWANALCAGLSGWLPARIVCCAESALRSHAAMGYRASRMVVIPNGFASEVLARDPLGGARVRSELSIAPEAPVVGLVSRFHPDKDPDNFLRAARLVAEADRRVVFVLAGMGLGPSNPALAARVDELGIRPYVRLLGLRSDVPALFSAMDVFALSSRSEAFPNVLGEAMLCGVPCAATDCGDAREIVGPTGRIVPPEDSAGLAGAILELLTLGERRRAELAVAARERIRARYDVSVVARRYAELYAEVSRSRPAP